VEGEARAHWRDVSSAPLPASFYARPTPEVARGLLGHVLLSELGGRRTAGRLVETEAYLGTNDPASHGYPARRTRRNASLFERPGPAYVHFTSGMPWSLNAVTTRPGLPPAAAHARHEGRYHSAAPRRAHRRPAHARRRAHGRVLLDLGGRPLCPGHRFSARPGPDRGRAGAGGQQPRCGAGHHGRPSPGR